MDITQLFLQRYNPLYEFYIADIWATVPADLMRTRPHPGVNSIAWNLWHLARAEDAGLNRFVVDRSQVLDDGGWMQRMQVPWRHHGSEMSFEEVDELSQRIDLPALQEYGRAVELRTREIIQSVHLVDLESTPTLEHVRRVVIDEGLAHSNGEGFAANYSGWTRGKCLLTFGLTHPFQHVGEIGVIASQLGVIFE